MSTQLCNHKFNGPSHEGLLTIKLLLVKILKAVWHRKNSDQSKPILESTSRSRFKRELFLQCFHTDQFFFPTVLYIIFVAICTFDFFSSPLFKQPSFCFLPFVDTLLWKTLPISTWRIKPEVFVCKIVFKLGQKGKKRLKRLSPSTNTAQDSE